jgi:phage terminase large subunit
MKKGNYTSDKTEKAIEKYVEQKLTKEEIDELWLELIQNDYYMDYLKTVATIYAAKVDHRSGLKSSKK